MKNSRISFASLLAIACSTLALAPVALADLRIGTIDIARVMNEAPGALAKKKELDAASEEASKKLENKGKDLQALKTKLEGQKVAADSKEAESFRNQAKEFERLRADMKADLEKKYMKVNKEMSEKILNQIEAYAKANKYDLIIDKSDKFRGPVVFRADSVDITDEILSELK